MPSKVESILVYGGLVLFLAIVILTLGRQESKGYESNCDSQINGCYELPRDENNIPYPVKFDRLKNTDTSSSDNRFILDQPEIGTMFTTSKDVEQLYEGVLYSDGNESTIFPHGILWMSMAIEDETILTNKNGKALTKHEFTHGLNMPWKVVGNF